MLTELEQLLERSSYDTRDEPMPSREAPAEEAPPANTQLMRDLAVRDDEKWRWLFGDAPAADNRRAETQAQQQKQPKPQAGNTNVYRLKSCID